MKLEKLSPEQEKLIPVIREEWIKFCLGGNNEINREVATKGIRWIYGLAKLESPFVIFVDGPMACQYAIQFIKAIMKNKKLTDQVRDQVWGQVWGQVRAEVWGQVGAQVRDQVGDQVRDQVRGQVRAQLKEAEYFAWCDSSADSGWVSSYDFFERIGIKVTENFKEYRKYIRSGVFMTIFTNGFAIACPRPLSVHKDGRNRLHNEKGVAVEWANGEKYWFWHGARVNEKIIMRPNELTKEEILSEKNSEVSRAISEKLGWDKYMEVLGTVLIDKWFDGDKSLHYELYDFKERKFSLMPRLLKMESPEVHDGTRPCYIEPVDPKLKRCKAARKWQMRVAYCSKCGLVAIEHLQMWRHGDVQITLQIACPKCEQVIDMRWPTVDECNKDSDIVFEVEA